MNDQFTDTFFTWADNHRVTRDQIADATGNSKQTISNWRSNGIPKGKQLGCQSLIDQHHQQTHAPQTGNSLNFMPTHAQFKRWNQAALEKGQLIEDWAFEGLEQLADKHFSKQLKLAEEDEVAEDPAPYPKANAAEDLPA
jgi:hypothetical protein